MLVSEEMWSTGCRSTEKGLEVTEWLSRSDSLCLFDMDGYTTSNTVPPYTSCVSGTDV